MKPCMREAVLAIVSGELAAMHAVLDSIFQLVDETQTIEFQRALHADRFALTCALTELRRQQLTRRLEAHAKRSAGHGSHAKRRDKSQTDQTERADSRLHTANLFRRALGTWDQIAAFARRVSLVWPQIYEQVS